MSEEGPSLPHYAQVTREHGGSEDPRREVMMDLSMNLRARSESPAHVVCLVPGKGFLVAAGKSIQPGAGHSD